MAGPAAGHGRGAWAADAAPALAAAAAAAAAAFAVGWWAATVSRRRAGADDAPASPCVCFACEGRGAPVDTTAAASPPAETAPRRAGQKADPYSLKKRARYLSWDDYFMAVAQLSAQRSKDPNKQVGACIVSKQRVILGIGYNGFPRGCPDDVLPWAKLSPKGDVLETKYPYVCHAEMNAIMNKNTASLEGSTLYVTMFPCNECAKLIIQAGIDAVVYHEAKAVARSEDGGVPDPIYAAAAKLLKLANVRLVQHVPTVAVSLSDPAKSQAGVLQPIQLFR